jgi:hypothetical protein
MPKTMPSSHFAGLTSPHLSTALGEAHRAELLRQADRYRRNRPAADRRSEHPVGALLRRALLWRGRVRRSTGTPDLTVATTVGGPGRQHAGDESIDRAA